MTAVARESSLTTRRRALQRAGAVLVDSARDPVLRAAQASFALAWLADWAVTVGIGIVAYRDAGSLGVGLIGLARMLPAAVIAPFASAVADRVRRERVLVAVSASRAVLFAAIAGLVAADRVAPVYALMVLASAVGVLFRPAHSALLPSLCRTAQQLAGANVARGLLDSVAVFAGPLLATLLLGLGSLPGVFAASAVLSAASALCVLRLRYEPPPRDERPGPVHVLRDAREGAATVLATPGLGVMFVLGAAQTFVRGAVTVFVVVLAIDVLDLGEATVGALTTAIGVGAVLGSLGASVLAHSKHLAVWFGVGVLLWGLPLALVAGAPTVAVAAAAFAVLGVGNALVDIGIFTLPARLVPDALLGRVYAALEAVVSVSVGLGALAAPLVIDVVGDRGALLVVGLLTPVVLLLGVRRLQRLDREMQDRDVTVAGLAAVPMLEQLPMPAIEHLARTLEEQVVPAGQDVVTQGRPGDGFYVLVRGEVDVLHDGVPVRVLTAGDAFGEVALLRDTVRTTTVRARGDVRVWKVHRQSFVAAVRSSSKSSAEATALMARLPFVSGAEELVEHP